MDNLHILANLYYNQFYDEISNYKISSYYEGIDENANKIKELLKDEDKKLVDVFKCGIINCCEERDFFNIADALNYGIKLGMELQAYFSSLF